MPKGFSNTRAGMLRQAVEFSVCLAVMVTLFRTFETESYMIETGSMAPCLLGYHRRVTCPACQFPFAIEGSQPASNATCPNCGKTGIPASDLIRHDGDQLLVYRGAYEMRGPRRWEVAVFRNPSRPTQSFVKRMIGLPGEKVQLVQGDVYIDGRLQTKNLATLRSMRIPVYDQDYRPPETDPEWSPRWVSDRARGRWVNQGGQFTFDGLERDDADPGEPEQVRYRHWIRRGGRHATSVQLSRWPVQIDLPESVTGPLRFDSSRNLLICHGCMPRDLLDRLLSQSGATEFVAAVERLYEASHIAPITDTYGYNRGADGAGRNDVRDLILALNLAIDAGAGEFRLGITDGIGRYECQFQVGERQVRLMDLESGAVVRSGPLPARFAGSTTLIELSLVDRQLLLALDGTLPFEPLSSPPSAQRGSTPWKPVWFSASGLKLRVSGLRLFRDVYYTAGDGRRGFDAPFQLQQGEYFALGDNSPISRDSRSWPQGRMLTSGLLQGKPFVVHLPSRKRRLSIGRWQADIRIPDLSRIRYID